MTRTKVAKQRRFMRFSMFRELFVLVTPGPRGSETAAALTSAIGLNALGRGQSCRRTHIG
jgi:hypothetical protein